MSSRTRCYIWIGLPYFQLSLKLEVFMLMTIKVSSLKPLKLKNFVNVTPLTLHCICIQSHKVIRILFISENYSLVVKKACIVIYFVNTSTCMSLQVIIHVYLYQNKHWLLSVKMVILKKHFVWLVDWLIDWMNESIHFKHVAK